jgi:hypothetical protein
MGLCIPNVSESFIFSIQFLIRSITASDVEMRSISDNEATEKIPATEESIDSFHDPTDRHQNDILKRASTAKADTPSRPRGAKATQHAAVEAKGQAKDLMCPCAANVEDEVMVQCEGCSVWYHIPCAGSAFPLPTRCRER